MSAPSKKLPIDEVPFLEAFGRDVDFVDFHDTYPQSVYLDLQTGDLLWLYDDDEDAYSEARIPSEDNAADRQRVANSPARYLEIFGLDHGEHHEILQEFFNSDWTDDDDARLKAREAYFGSIGGWKKTVADERVVYAFYDFQSANPIPCRRVSQSSPGDQWFCSSDRCWKACMRRSFGSTLADVDIAWPYGSGLALSLI